LETSTKQLKIKKDKKIKKIILNYIIVIKRYYVHIRIRKTESFPSLISFGILKRSNCEIIALLFTRNKYFISFPTHHFLITKKLCFAFMWLIKANIELSFTFNYIAFAQELFIIHSRILYIPLHFYIHFVINIMYWKYFIYYR